MKKTKLSPLTDAQRNLIEENKRLLFFFANKFTRMYPTFDPADILDAVFLGAIYAASVWTPKKGAWGTCLRWYVRSEVSHLISYVLAQKRNGSVLSLDALSDETGGKSLGLEDRSMETIDDNVVHSDWVEAVRNAMTPREFDIAKEHFFHEKPFWLIGQERGVTKQAVQHCWKKSANRVRKELGALYEAS